MNTGGLAEPRRQPDVLTKNVYAQLMGRTWTAEHGWHGMLSAAGKTGVLARTCHYGGIVHFVYLTCSYPAFYRRPFQDVPFKLDPISQITWARHSSAGCLYQLLQRTLRPAVSGVYRHDGERHLPGRSGQLVLTLKPGRQVLSEAKMPMRFPELGDRTFQVRFSFQTSRGTAFLRPPHPDGNAPDGPTLQDAGWKLDVSLRRLH